MAYQFPTNPSSYSTYNNSNFKWNSVGYSPKNFGADKGPNFPKHYYDQNALPTSAKAYAFNSKRYFNENDTPYSPANRDRYVAQLTSTLQAQKGQTDQQHAATMARSGLAGQGVDLASQREQNYNFSKATADAAANAKQDFEVNDYLTKYGIYRDNYNDYMQHQANALANEQMRQGIVANNKNYNLAQSQLDMQKWLSPLTAGFSALGGIAGAFSGGGKGKSA